MIPPNEYLEKLRKETADESSGYLAAVLTRMRESEEPSSVWPWALAALVELKVAENYTHDPVDGKRT